MYSLTSLINFLWNLFITSNSFPLYTLNGKSLILIYSTIIFEMFCSVCSRYLDQIFLMKCVTLSLDGNVLRFQYRESLFVEGISSASLKSPVIISYTILTLNHPSPIPKSFPQREAHHQVRMQEFPCYTKMQGLDN